jgi:hypothetical protein
VQLQRESSTSSRGAYSYSEFMLSSTYRFKDISLETPLLCHVGHGGDPVSIRR